VSSSPILAGLVPSFFFFFFFPLFFFFALFSFWWCFGIFNDFPSFFFDVLSPGFWISLSPSFVAGLDFRIFVFCLWFLMGFYGLASKWTPAFLLALTATLMPLFFRR